MDREFCLYLIEIMSEHLPLVGEHVVLDFAHPHDVGVYHINASLQLAIPLGVEDRVSHERHLLEDVALVDLLDEDEAIEAMLRWCEAWAQIIAKISTGDMLSLDPKRDFLATSIKKRSCTGAPQ